MLNIIQNIPNINTYPLVYVFEKMKLCHKPNTLWLDFGIGYGTIINYMSKFTNDKIYGFDIFDNTILLQAKENTVNLSTRIRSGSSPYSLTSIPETINLPRVNDNVELINNELLPNFLKIQNKKISFIHLDDIDILDTLKDYIDTECIIVLDEFVNYQGFDIENGKLHKFYQFIKKNNVKYEWIGMNGTPTDMSGYNHEIVILIIRSIN